MFLLIFEEISRTQNVYNSSDRIVEPNYLTLVLDGIRRNCQVKTNLNLRNFPRIRVGRQVRSCRMHHLYHLHLHPRPPLRMALVTEGVDRSPKTLKNLRSTIFKQEARPMESGLHRLARSLASQKSIHRVRKPKPPTHGLPSPYERHQAGL